jgi:ABC-type dipeptide/oligopeptide/nickel transport system permease component
MKTVDRPWPLKPSRAHSRGPRKERVGDGGMTGSGSEDRSVPAPTTTPMEPRAPPSSEGDRVATGEPPRSSGRGWLPRRSRSSEAARRLDSRVLRFVAMRLALLPIQLVFILFLLYAAIQLPTVLVANPHLALVGYLQGFEQMVINIVTGNWGSPPPGSFYARIYPNVSWFQLYADFLPNSIELALFSLPIAALVAYPLSLLLGWSRRSVVDVPARMITLFGVLLPSFVIGTILVFVLFFPFFAIFHDINFAGLIPTDTWFDQYYGTIPSWVLYGQVTRPTGFPLVDGAIHQAWAFESITLTKTLIQASIVAIAYVAFFLRHARTLVASASQEFHVLAARSRGVSERTLLWRHTARRVMPTLWLVFALTIPAYLVTQFVVEGLFLDPGVGILTLSALTSGANLAVVEGLIFLLAAFVLVSVFVVDLIANHLDPRGATTR